jgi:hypothetical protein
MFHIYFIKRISVQVVTEIVQNIAKFVQKYEIIL